MKSYRGFTIVELAIVLVVIGIILAMAVKGKQLVDAARFKAEINKMRKLEAAMHVYAATHSGFSKGFGEDTIDLQAFYDLGIVSPSELASSYLGQKELNTQSHAQFNGLYDATYTPFVCDTNGREGHYYRTDAKQGTFCGGLSYWDFYNSGAGFGPSQLASMPLAIQCGIELMLDDENVTTGLGRRGSTESDVSGGRLDSANLTKEEYADCMALSFGEPSGYWTGQYYYKIF